MRQEQSVARSAAACLRVNTECIAADHTLGCSTLPLSAWTCSGAPRDSPDRVPWRADELSRDHSGLPSGGSDPDQRAHVPADLREVAYHWSSGTLQAS